MKIEERSIVEREDLGEKKRPLVRTFNYDVLETVWNFNYPKEKFFFFFRKKKVYKDFFDINYAY